MRLRTGMVRGERMVPHLDGSHGARPRRTSRERGDSMTASTVSTAPDLDFSSPWVLLAIALVLVIAAAVMWRHERRQNASHDAGAARARGLDSRTVVVGLQERRGEDASARRMGDGVHGDRRSSDHAQPRADAHALTDDEVVALARWFAIGRATPPHLAHAVDKLNRRAADILNADRARRR